MGMTHFSAADKTQHIERRAFRDKVKYISTNGMSSCGNSIKDRISWILIYFQFICSSIPLNGLRIYWWRIRIISLVSCVIHVFFSLKTRTHIEYEMSNELWHRVDCWELCPVFFLLFYLLLDTISNGASHNNRCTKQSLHIDYSRSIRSKKQKNNLYEVNKSDSIYSDPVKCFALS